MEKVFFFFNEFDYDNNGWNGVNSKNNIFLIMEKHSSISIEHKIQE